MKNMQKLLDKFGFTNIAIKHKGEILT